ncbi:hypothetical protein Abu_0942 [Aliarcobacter butzleri RM4018]|uniref:Uncharacterized protein n=2 Tax=Aliarcobacter butzleri TaxID=28197 RepID=A8ETC8_ALIB4|nr:hypothetical protein [Aliarcobacter butzleri]ABV67202.1 hypothetical protein Abu_0942 [Aliarcobacter butzleri RM4018]MDN5108490.1 hypothetical protein [Aliarcobacter butzleri]MDN5124611.1 hypothetical protein [Aliarcobacter butzleri]SNV27249.1 Uncharacterised protein [Aliarcobacter butzleri]GGT85726.1 hypothetical protein GCM10007985_22580 [Aliarcobacter butzleri]
MFKQIITGVIVTIISMIFSLYISDKSNSNELEYKDSKKEQYLNISNEVFKDFTLLYKDNKIEQISMYQVGFFNRTKREIENVEIFFEFKKAIPNIINKEFFNPSNLPSSVGISEIEKVNDRIYKVNIKVFKQTGDDKYYLARFIFEGNEIPEISFSTPNNSNLDIVEFSNIKEIFFAIGIFLLFIIVMVFIFMLLLDYDSNRNWKKREQRLEKALKESRKFDDINIKEILIIHENIFKLKNSFLYNKIKYFIEKIKSNNK